MILLTTSHLPAKGIRTLCHDLARSIPGLTRINRGKMSLHEVAEKAAELNAEKITIIDRWKGGSGRIRLLEIWKNKVTQVSPEIYIRAVKLQREFRAARKPIRTLFINGKDEGNSDVKRLKGSLSDFGIPVMNIKEASGECRLTMRFSKDPSDLLQISLYILAGNIEIGPRITVSHVVWKT